MLQTRATELRKYAGQVKKGGKQDLELKYPCSSLTLVKKICINEICYSINQTCITKRRAFHFDNSEYFDQVLMKDDLNGLFINSSLMTISPQGGNFV